MKATCHCGAEWTGLRIEHCTACHQTFTGTTSGDRHRVGKHEVDHGPERRRCLTVAEMVEKGLERNERGQWTNGGTSPWASGSPRDAQDGTRASAGVEMARDATASPLGPEIDAQDDEWRNE